MRSEAVRRWRTERAEIAGGVGRNGSREEEGSTHVEPDPEHVFGDIGQRVAVSSNEEHCQRVRGHEDQLHRHHYSHPPQDQQVLERLKAKCDVESKTELTRILRRSSIRLWSEMGFIWVIG